MPCFSYILQTKSDNIEKYIFDLVTPVFLDSSWKNAAESFTVALTLTLGVYKSAIAPRKKYHS